tara:strand:- start:2049 stop:2198 length:150 start_codon:yes stop_codon:yes gene_type:complete
MIKNILELLKDANGETEAIRFAQGSKKLPDGFKEGFKQMKKESIWQMNK